MNKSVEPNETNSCTIGADGANQCRDNADGGGAGADQESPSVIQTLHSQQDADAFLSANEAVIVEFMTNWCCNCQAIEERYRELAMSGEESGVRSAKVVCDKNKQTKKLAAQYNVRSYPVFVVFKDGVVSNRFDGADRGKLEAAFERLGGGSGSGGKKKKRGGRSKRS